MTKSIPAPDPQPAPRGDLAPKRHVSEIGLSEAMRRSLTDMRRIYGKEETLRVLTEFVDSIVVKS